MKPLLTTAMVAVATLVLGATLVLTCAEPSSDSPSFNISAPDRNFVFSTPVSIHPGEPPNSHSLQPGIHQSNSPSFDILPKNRGFVLSKPAPIYLDKLPTPPPPLQPGVYQTYPWTIIIIAPGSGIDDRIFGESPNARSQMPRIKPHVKAIPLSQANP